MRQLRLLLELRWADTVLRRAGVAVIVDHEQLRRQGVAAVVPLAFLRIDADLHGAPLRSEGMRWYARSGAGLPSGQAPPGVLPVHRLLRHAERHSDLLPHDSLVAGPADEGRFPALDVAPCLTNRRQLAQHTFGSGRFLIERRPHE